MYGMVDDVNHIFPCIENNKIAPTSSGEFRKSVKGWRFTRGAGNHSEKTVFEVYSSQYNPYFFVSCGEKMKK
jgi:hypothetical protein